MGIMTPNKGVRVMTRTGQRLLGSDVELIELICRVLGEVIASANSSLVSLLWFISNQGMGYSLREL